jgi:hypothetical protein
MDTQASYISHKEYENIFRNNMKISSYSMSIKTLFSDRMQKKIDYNPYYQRNYVWDKTKATFFIESILLGTDIPPLIFFNSGGKFEVIDGRQRFETIKRFREGDLSLHIKGLMDLPQLKNKTFNKIGSNIRSIFDDVKIRIFEFQVINEPKLSDYTEDKIKKEIFRRYNSGITVLNTSEIDNAVFDDDQITKAFKDAISNKTEFVNRISETFLGKKVNKELDISKILQLLRKHFILSSFPISHYARTNNRQEIFNLLYDFFKENNDINSLVIEDYFNSIKIVLDLKDFFEVNGIRGNKTLYETILWAICIVKKEKELTEILLSKEQKTTLLIHFLDNESVYDTDFYHYYKETINRFKVTADVFEKLFKINFNEFIKDDEFSGKVKELRQDENEAKLKLDELSNLRVNKPDASFIPVAELIGDLETKRYLIRPSYQRQERINEYKASSIIESILLGIYLPPIFIYKNSDGVKEVIDGQQRILSILGFIGKQYLNEENQLVYSKNNNYKLKGLKIIKELNRKRFGDLELEYQDKIWDFLLQLIEIDSNINPLFQPVNLFIRLNNKPYPIKENSFEMWNSFGDKDIIKRIKEITGKYNSWFYIKNPNKKNFIDRMHNEELITILCYINFNNQYRTDYSSIGYYIRKDKITGRISDKRDVSNLIDKLALDIIDKKRFIKCIEEVEEFILLVSNIFENKDLKDKLDSLYNIGGESSIYRRSLIDFYLLFDLLKGVSKEDAGSIDFKELKSDFNKLTSLLKNTRGVEIIDEAYRENFLVEKKSIILKYQ